MKNTILNLALIFGLLLAIAPQHGLEAAETLQTADAQDGIAKYRSRDYLSVVGSSTVYPFAQKVSEEFVRKGGYKDVRLVSTGSGGGFKLFCSGLNSRVADITNASRRIKSSEVKTCADNGVTEIVEVKIGYDGIVMAHSNAAADFELTPRDIYLALAAQVPNPNGSQSLVRNPHRTWRDVNSSLPNTRIEVHGPPPLSGTRDAFVELALEAGCKTTPWVAALESSDRAAYNRTCRSIRDDNVFIVSGENDALIINNLVDNRNALGIFGYNFLYQNAGKVKAVAVNGLAPNSGNIADGTYSLSRGLYFYVKKAQIGIIPGVQEYMQEFTSDRAFGDGGYLTDVGLIPMPDFEQSLMASNVSGLTVLKADDI